MIQDAMKEETIFIQIASYRDPELPITLQSCIENANNPENLRFGICRQFREGDGFDEIPEYENDPRFRVVNVDWKKAKGVCWARNIVQNEYDGEAYTLQIDSHHRFAPGWDTICKELSCVADKKFEGEAILSCFASGRIVRPMVMKPFGLAPPTSSHLQTLFLLCRTSGLPGRPPAFLNLQSFPNLFAFSNLSKRLIFSAFLNLLGVSTFLSFPEHFCEIPAKFHQIFAEKSQNSSKNAKKMTNFQQKFGRFFAEFLRSERCKSMKIL